ncbi:hypothetical protein F2Q69_00017800 [Brassica cretica]|uniref:Uncharacterized protein n=1 Tax=Brassica cretica TaxID=69181 RepID=A0A8S9R4G6_BRACR|nr:hypothetical protein F2Q69_00017800 [Brassica cretica]
MGSNSGGGGSSVIDSAIFVSSRVRVSELGMKKTKWKLPPSSARGSRSGNALASLPSDEGKPKSRVLAN